MRSFLFAAATVASLCVISARQASAEQQVTLQSGAVIVGEVTVDGADLVIDVDGAEVRVPFKDVTLVASGDEHGVRQADRLLMRALEARLQYGEGRDTGILAEAYRLAPDDARIAYWYARSLVEAGYGEGANDVFQEHRDAIAETYPGIAQQLAGQIRRRVQLESLPSRLVKRIDQIEHASGGVATNDEGDLHSAYFRLIDQHGEPVPPDAYRISVSGNREKTETFEDGYVLFTFLRRASYDAQPCRIDLQKSSYRAQQFEFHGATDGAADAGEFKAYRYGDADRVAALINVVGPDGKPLAGVSVSASSSRGGDAGAEPQTTGDDGFANLELFPGEYSVRGARSGYNSAADQLAIRANQTPDPMTLTLHRLVGGAARVEWRMRIVGYPGQPAPGGEAVASGEAELSTAGESPGPYGPNLPWVRFAQRGDQLQLHFMSQPYYPNATAEDFVGLLQTDEGDDDATGGASPEDRFQAINLEKLDDLKPQVDVRSADPRRTRGRPVTELDVNENAIYVGRISSRDPQRGQPAVFEFKVLVTEVARPEAE